MVSYTSGFVLARTVLTSNTYAATHTNTHGHTQGDTERAPNTNTHILGHLLKRSRERQRKQESARAKEWLTLQLPQSMGAPVCLPLSHLVALFLALSRSQFMETQQATLLSLSRALSLRLSRG